MFRQHEIKNKIRPLYRSQREENYWGVLRLILTIRTSGRPQFMSMTPMHPVPGGLVVAANLIAWPVAYKLMQEWLQEFAYRIHLSPTPFFLSGAVVGILFLIVVGIQAARVARVDPAETLRSE